MNLWVWYWLLLALNFGDAASTAIEVTKVPDIEANPVMAHAMDQLGPFALVVLKAVWFLALAYGLQRIIATRSQLPVLGILKALTVVFGALMLWHGFVLYHIS